jgi:hypothetical protein
MGYVFGTLTQALSLSCDDLVLSVPVVPFCVVISCVTPTVQVLYSTVLMLAAMQLVECSVLGCM